MSTQVTTAMISELREKTGAGILDCKKALTNSNANMEEAIKFLREKGLANAAKKSANIAADGVVAISVSSDYKSATIAEINCQTDFVAKGDSFVAIAKQVLSVYANSKSSDVVSALTEKMADGETLEQFLKSSIAQVGENIQLRRGQKVVVSNGFVASYIHNQINPSMGKIGVVLAIETSSQKKDEILDFGRKICMHIASMNPLSLDESGVPASAIENEKQIFTTQAQQSGKPAEVIAKMVEGRIKKFLAESVLLNQPFVMDGKTSVAEFTSNFAKQIGSPLELKSFVVFKLGEGIEKKDDNFADEVASMMKA